jgi:hypothetical protein
MTASSAAKSSTARAVSVSPSRTDRHYNQLASTLPANQRKLLAGSLATTHSDGHSRQPRCSDSVPRSVPYTRSLISQVKERRGPAYAEMKARIEVKTSSAEAIRAADDKRAQERYVEHLKYVISSFAVLRSFLFYDG